jgi:hypothetical protein
MSEFECRYGHYVRFGEDCAACAAEGRFGERTYYMDGISPGAWRKKERQEEQQAREEDGDE